MAKKLSEREITELEIRYGHESTVPDSVEERLDSLKEMCEELDDRIQRIEAWIDAQEE